MAAPIAIADRDDGVDRRLQTGRGAREHRRRRPCAGGVGDLLHGPVVSAREVLRQATDGLREDQPHHHGRHAPEADLIERRPLGVADVPEADRADADHGDDAGRQEAPVDRLQGVRLALLRLHRVHTDDRCDDPDGARRQREDEPDRRVHTDGAERRDAEDYRGDEGHFVRLEEVGGHARAVADVVADVVGDRCGVARIVLGDSRLDLADQIGTDVGGLREDPATDTQEEGQQRAAEAESHEDRRARVLEDRDDHGRTGEAQPDREHPGDTPGAERDMERLGERAGAGGSSRPDVAARRERHADVARETRHDAARYERERPGYSRHCEAETAAAPREALGLGDLGRGDEDDDRERDEDHQDRAELALEIGPCALLDRRRDLDHLRSALVGGEHTLHQGEADEDREDRRDRRECEDGPLTSLQHELLVAAFGSQY